MKSKQYNTVFNVYIYDLAGDEDILYVEKSEAFAIYNKEDIDKKEPDNEWNESLNKIFNDTVTDDDYKLKDNELELSEDEIDEIMKKINQKEQKGGCRRIY